MKVPCLNLLKRSSVFLITAFTFIILTFQVEFGQTVEKISQTGVLPGAANSEFDLSKDFRIEKTPVKGGAEIITVFARLKGLKFPGRSFERSSVG